MSLRIGDIRVSGPDLPQTLIAGVGRPPVPLPARFHVVQLAAENGRVRLLAHDGREVVATPGQLTAWCQLVSEHLNPDYQAQFEAEFLDRPRRAADDTDDPALTAPVTDDRLGTIEIHPPGGFGETAEVADIRPVVPGIPWTDSAAGLFFEELDDLNVHLVGPIEVVHEFR